MFVAMLRPTASGTDFAKMPSMPSAAQRRARARAPHGGWRERRVGGRRTVALQIGAEVVDDVGLQIGVVERRAAHFGLCRRALSERGGGGGGGGGGARTNEKSVCDATRFFVGDDATLLRRRATPPPSAVDRRLSGCAPGATLGAAPDRSAAGAARDDAGGGGGDDATGRFRST